MYFSISNKVRRHRKITKKSRQRCATDFGTYDRRNVPELFKPTFTKNPCINIISGTFPDYFPEGTRTLSIA